MLAVVTAVGRVGGHGRAGEHVRLQHRHLRAQLPGQAQGVPPLKLLLHGIPVIP